MSEAYLWYGIKLPDQDYVLPWETDDMGDDWGDIDAWWKKVKGPGDESDPPVSEIEYAVGGTLEYAVGGILGLAIVGAYAWVSDEYAEPVEMGAIAQAMRDSSLAFLRFVEQHIQPTLPKGWDIRVGWWMGCANT